MKMSKETKKRMSEAARKRWTVRKLGAVARKKLKIKQVDYPIIPSAWALPKKSGNDTSNIITDNALNLRDLNGKSVNIQAYDNIVLGVCENKAYVLGN